MIDIDMKENDNSLEYVKNMLLKMKEINASDLYMSWNKEDVKILYRSDGNVNKKNYTISKDFADTVRYTLIALSGEDEYLKVIDGKFTIKLNENKIKKEEENEHKNEYESKNETENEFRLSIAETVNGYAIVIRQYDFFNTNVELSKLGFYPKVIDLIKNIIKKHRYGLFLVTGATGSGKTTTLYTLLNYLKKTQTSIIKTVEDPVEIYLDGIDQFQINTKGEKKYQVTYNTAIKTFLRQRPDYILIGEIRDDEVAEYTFRASFTGHFVFSTLHTGSVENSIIRLLDLNISKDKIEDSLTGVLNQFLIPKLCDCKIKEEDGTFKANPNGCDKCNHNKKLGYKGLNVVGEIAKFDLKINNYKKENWEQYISIKDNLDYFLKNGDIDKITYNFYLPKDN